MQSFEPGSGGVGSYIAQGLIALFILLLVALFLRTAVVVSTLVWMPFVQRFGRKGRDSSGSSSDVPAPPAPPA